LKERFECIIIDSSPIGIVSDSYHLATIADTCLLIVRQNMTLKGLLKNTAKELNYNDIKSISLVFNDLSSAYKPYRYSYHQRYKYK